METILKEYQFNNYKIRGIFTKVPSTNKNVILCIPGFGRSAVSEKKFKKFSDSLATKNLNCFRFDFLGTGISDGEFKFTTVEHLSNQVKFIIKSLEDDGYKVNSIISHSLGGCVVAKLINENLVFEKIVLISPALNQKTLQRYWFSQKRGKSLGKEVTFNNYLNFYDEEMFTKDMNQDGKMTKNDYINKEYFVENMNMDYSNLLININTNQKNILMIQGLKDEAVPFESQNYKPQNLILVENGDHDLERPDLIQGWLQKAVEFCIIN